MRKRMKIRRYNWKGSQRGSSGGERGARPADRCSYSRMAVALPAAWMQWRDLQNNGFCAERGETVAFHQKPRESVLHQTLRKFRAKRSDKILFFIF